MRYRSLSIVPGVNRASSIESDDVRLTLAVSVPPVGAGPAGLRSCGDVTVGCTTSV
jgi:hypothetical protein